MDREIRELQKEVKRMEEILVESIIKNINDLNIDINIIENKIRTSTSILKKYELHFLEESLYLEPIEKKIVYNNKKIGYNDIIISSDYYIKMIMNVINRKKYFEMIEKRNNLEILVKGEIDVDKS
mgnify:CR=1 FL=1